MKMQKSKKYLSSVLALAMVLSSLTIGLLVYGSDTVAINQANFPDRNWRTVVSNEYDEDGNGYLSQDELTVYSIILPGLLEDYCGEDAQISSLKGIEYFTSLKRLYCGGVGLSSLNVSELTNLEQLTCQGNNMSVLTLGNLPRLTWLNCASNDLVSINISGCPALERLDCYSNSLTALSAVSCPALQELFCQQNELTSINVRGLTALRTIYCANNHLWELDLSTNTSLQGITSYMLANQTVSAVAEKSGNSIAVMHEFSRNDFVMSSSFDEDTDTGSVIPGFDDGYFLTTHPEKVVDGLDYKYYTGNSNSDNMSVHVDLTRNFCIVRYFLDEDMTDLYDSRVVEIGGDCDAPVIADATDCMAHIGWSQDCIGVTEDTDVYALWQENHDFRLVTFSNGVITVRCDTCDISENIRFMDIFDAREGDDDFMLAADVVRDGCINAKDYAKLKKDYR